ncbi:MAG: 2-phospho-L-lactate transferase [Pseudomonadales bacterium]|nr:2-phospho-L-lactate transferase [Pseudomonadales bacterium]
MAEHIVALSGGVGGAKLALGFAHLLAPGQLTVIANTGDDFTHLGLKICPDLDTVMYTLADLNNKELGWGQAGETWQFLDALEKLGGEAWFRLGDRDMATHIRRTGLLAEGLSLSDTTLMMCEALGIAHPLLPMTDDLVATMVRTRSGEELAFQHYFVRDRCEPEVTGFRFQGLENALPAPGVLSALGREDLAAVVICPSNPFVSVDPILYLPGLMQALKDAGRPVIAVSPIVGGMAIKGPAAKMMQELGMPSSALAVATHYQGRIDGFVLDEADADLRAAVEALGIPTIVTKTVMITLADRIDLARSVLEFSRQLSA